MQKSWGLIPIEPTQMHDTDLVEAIESLQSVQMFGDFVVDTMELEKHIWLCFFLPSKLVFYQLILCLTKLPISLLFALSQVVLYYTSRKKQSRNSQL